MTKEQATQLGRDMIANLGKSWTLKVHENIGWHASAYSPTGHLRVSVYASRSDKPTYSCLMTDDPKQFLGCGNPLWTNGRPCKIYTDPVEAVIDQVNYARAKVNALDFALREVEITVAEFTCPCCGKSRTN
jgi:hypothetical protein